MAVTFTHKDTGRASSTSPGAGVTIAGAVCFCRLCRANILWIPNRHPSDVNSGCAYRNFVTPFRVASADGASRILATSLLFAPEVVSAF